jgi:hypothetical protein
MGGGLREVFIGGNCERRQRETTLRENATAANKAPAMKCSFMNMPCLLTPYVCCGAALRTPPRLTQHEPPKIMKLPAPQVQAPPQALNLPSSPSPRQTKRTQAFFEATTTTAAAYPPYEPPAFFNPLRPLAPTLPSYKERDSRGTNMFRAQQNAFDDAVGKLGSFPSALHNPLASWALPRSGRRE